VSFQTPDRRTVAVRVGIGLTAMLLLAAPGPPSPTQFLDQFDVYLGNLHAHTTLSDGSGTPEEAYRKAREAGLDFMAVTEHNHSDAERPKEDPAFGSGIASDHSLYSELTTAANQANHNDQFVTFFGMEFSTISSGNHINVLGASKVIDETEVPSGDFKTFYEQWLPNDAGVQFIQFNHPWENNKNKERDYGLKQFQNSYRKVREASGQWLRTMAVISGPALKLDTHQKVKVQGKSQYENLLTRDFRIGPTADQDTHHHTWGSSTNGRTGVLAARLTRADLLDGINKRRVFGSTDTNLKVWFGVAGAVMGSEIEVTDRDLQVVVKIEDADEPDARYKVTLISGSPKVPKQTTATKLLEPTGDGTNTATWHMTGNAKFVYAIVEQWPGDSDNRDTLVTSPVWVSVTQ